MKNPAYFGEFGGMFVPELLVPALKQLENEFNKAQKDPQFQAELSKLLNEYAGRPTPLTLTRNLIKNPTPNTPNTCVGCVWWGVF